MIECLTNNFPSISEKNEKFCAVNNEIISPIFWLVSRLQWDNFLVFFLLFLSPELFVMDKANLKWSLIVS